MGHSWLQGGFFMDLRREAENQGHDWNLALLSGTLMAYLFSKFRDAGSTLA